MRLAVFPGTFALVALVAGCGGADRPAGPTALVCPGAQVPLCTDVAHAALVRAALADAGTRLVPALAAPDTRAVLGARIDALSAALEAGDVAGARASLAATRRALDEARGPGSAPAADGADLDAIAITLQEVADALAGS